MYCVQLIPEAKAQKEEQKEQRPEQPLLKAHVFDKAAIKVKQNNQKR